MPKYQQLANSDRFQQTFLDYRLFQRQVQIHFLHLKETRLSDAIVARDLPFQVVLNKLVKMPLSCRNHTLSRLFKYHVIICPQPSHPSFAFQDLTPLQHITK